MGGVTPRMLCLDDYFMTDVEQEVVDSNGKKSTKIVCQQYFSFYHLFVIISTNLPILELFDYVIYAPYSKL